MAELRQQPRVVFSAKARIHSDGDEQSVVARVHNLSASGIYVTAPRPLRPGAVVKCRLYLGEDNRVLRGRVAWTKRAAVPGAAWAAGAAEPANENAAGIHFVDLSPTDAALLQRLVSPRPEDERSAEIQFSGMPSPVRCRAVVTREGLRIVTRLPFLRLGSDVKVSFENRGVRESRAGRLDALLLAPADDDPVPRLLLSVSTAEPEEVGGEIEVAPPPGKLPDEPEAVPSTLVDEAALFSPPPDVASTPEEAPPIVTQPRPAERSDPTQRVAIASVAPPPGLAALAASGSSSTVRVLIAAGLVAVAMVGGALALGRGRRAAAPIAAAPSPSVATPGSAPPPAAAPPPAETPKPAIAIEPLPTVAAEPAVSTVEDRGVRLERAGGRTTVFVSLGGSTRQADHYPLRSPAGVVVTLPHAQPRQASGVHAFASSIVRQVLVERKGSGAHLRFLFAGPVETSSVHVEPGGVRLDVDVK